MVLDSLSEKLRGALQKITKAGLVDRDAVIVLSSEIKKALVGADVNIKLAKDIAQKIRNRALKEKPAKGLTAREHTVNIVFDELTNFLGKDFQEIKFAQKPTVLLLVGLFGSGKTTTAGKLAKYYKRAGKKVAVVQTDTWRPAAYEQLKTLAEKIHVQFYGDPKETNPLKIIQSVQSNFSKFDLVIIDSAGRDALNKELTNEIKAVVKALKPNEVLLVLSGDIGQAAEKQAKSFHESARITGVIVTKLDGTAKGGGALSACAATDTKVKFIGVGEKLDAIEEFRPKNFVSQLLGMGDLETLLKKAEKAIDKEQAEKLGKKVIKGDFSLQDLYDQMGAVSKMGSLGQLANMIPGMANLPIPKGALKDQEKNMQKWKYLMDSMTLQEKEHPDTINASRIKRIAKGSGRPESAIRELLKQYKQMKKMMKLTTGGRGGQMKKMMKMFGGKMPDLSGLGIR